MVEAPKTHDHFTAALKRLTTAGSITRAEVTVLRRDMDAACDRGDITLKQWRELLDVVAGVQANLPR